MIYQNEISIDEAGFIPRYDIVDSHLHFLDFVQESDGFAALTEAMDASGVSEAVVFGMPIVKKWDYLMKRRPHYYLSNDSRCYYYSATDHILANELLSAPEEIRKRFHPFCCGFECTDKYAAKQIELLLKMYPGFWCGIGELMSRHDDLTALTYGEGLHMDSPAFRMIYDLAAAYDLPVLVHHNLSPKHCRDPLYVYELIRALEHNPECRIIWAHVGMSREIEMEDLLIIAAGLLNDHPNLYVDISWVFYDNYVRGDLMRFGDHGTGSFEDLWAPLIEKYSDRVLLGTDKVGHWADYPGQIGKYYPLLDQLKPETAEKVCRGNVLSLIKKWQ